MKKQQRALLAAACMVLALTAGCKSVTCTTCENHTTLQGTIMDAITGDRIGGVTSGNTKDIDIFLIQGDTIRKPTTFISDETNPLVGEYSFTDIPSGSNLATGNLTNPTDPEHNEYKIIVIKKGYQRFEGKVDLYNIDNKIGNVYLFPEGYNAPDYTFQVVYNDAPISGATVLFKPVVTSNTALAEISGDIIAASNGYLPSLTGETDAQGKVTFAGSPIIDDKGNVTYPGLALGAAYKVIVPSVHFEGVPLAYYQDGAVRIVGFGTFTDIISMSDLVPGNNPYGLYVVSISNSKDGQVDPTGTLTIVFSRPVTLKGNFSAIETSPAGILAAVSANLSADGLTLTLTPVWTTNPGAGDTNTSIIYTNTTAFVSVQGYPDTSYVLFGGGGLVDANGDLISGTVHLSGP